ncbi:UDP-3-O-(3-hydroxymyristoyl) N-acetylglucosamine deacetylase [Desulfovibrio sp. X2]|uniref:UDP-3-O-acyl-N-acetylglucosamine deacetylase n=1 Tax=Desulfovibrio sp. X2 TaxID=941449 RepID=UPI0003587E98|nr:UDP-3-O-acyl-N-acetylglucosamine deacetylase [Desulfovibrio sp. X2]EPR38747.1 UDP-3-O-(3-hydroxymyristoyl) N-acetylglucosamine deacetylase [Desulfovibrio sp. X2]
MHQKTIRKPISCAGIGLHSGKKVHLSLRPAPEDTGILFCVRDENGSRFLKPAPDSVHSTRLATTLARGRDAIATVEHILAAIRGMGIDNVLIEVQGGELPIMDGSAAPFVYLLRLAGTQVQNRARRVMALKKPIEFVREGKWIKAEPFKGFAVDYSIEFNHPMIGRQEFFIELTPDLFARRLAKARTFGFLQEVEMLRANGLALGGSLENAVVLDEFGVVNEDGLRFKDEFVRHKVLDFVGDMAMYEAPLWGRFEVHASGHALNNEFLRYITANADEYLEEVVLGEPRAAAREKACRPMPGAAPALA